MLGYLKNASKKQIIKLAASLVCTLAMAAIVALWWHNNPDYPAYSYVSALLSASLFTLMGLCFIPKWVDAWSRGSLQNEQSLQSKEPRLMTLKVFAAVLAVDAFIILFVWLLQQIGDRVSFSDSTLLWRQLDSQHYLDIAEHWYTTDVNEVRTLQLVFLPGYPLLVRLVALLVGDYFWSAMAVSAVCFAASGAMLYRLARLDMTHQQSLRAVKYLCLMPAVFFFASPMSESLFILLSLCSIYFARKKLWPLAGLMGGLAAFTRSLGLVLLAPLLFEFIRQQIKHPPIKKNVWRRVLGGISLLLVLLGFSIYLYINYRCTGNAFKFLQYQKSNWSQQLGLFFNTPAYQSSYLAAYINGGDWHSVFGLSIPSLLAQLLALLLMVLSISRLRASYGAYFIAYFAIAIGTTWLLSAPRYLLTLFPLPLSLALLSNRKSADTALTITSTILMTFYTLAFVLRWQVW